MTTRQRWWWGAWIVGLLAFLGVQLARADLDALDATGTAWALLWGALASATVACFVRAARSPVAVVEPTARPDGLAADGPERRRVARALRDRTPLDPDDKQRAVERARFELAGNGTRDHWRHAGCVLLTMTIAIGAGGVGRSPVDDGAWFGALMLVGMVGLAVTSGVGTWRASADRSSAHARLRRLEAHPTTQPGRDP